MRTLAAVFTLAALITNAGAWAQPYPAKPVRLIVPTAPAGATDSVARMLAQKLTEQMGQAIVVENRPGANGNIAAEAVARSAPDGYTILIGTIGVMSINPFVYKQVGYDPVRDFVAISQLVLMPLILVVHPSLPVSSIAEEIRKWSNLVRTEKITVQ